MNRKILQVAAVIAGGMFVQFGPTVGAVITLLLAESLRVLVGHEIHGLDGTIYGLKPDAIAWIRHRRALLHTKRIAFVIRSG